MAVRVQTSNISSNVKETSYSYLSAICLWMGVVLRLVVSRMH